MNKLKLTQKFHSNVTLITNDFVDHYMIHANGEFVKVYLFLLRHLDDSDASFTISSVADSLNHTENDILRAFRYWESEGLFQLERDEQGEIIGIEISRTPMKDCETSCQEAVPVTEPQISNVEPIPMSEQDTTPIKNIVKEHTLTPVSTIAPVESIEHTYEQTCDRTPTRTKAVEMSSFKAQKEIKSLLFITEQYLSKTLSKSDVDAITYFYETLGMSADLIEYLVESCVENGHKSMHYIQKVALSWSDQQITTKEQARRQSASYNKNCYAVLRAFGIHSRGPAASEIAYIQKWTDELGFSIDLVQEACNRTISAIHQPSFEYADSILTNWHKKQVRHLKDLSDIDSAFQKERASRMHSVPMKSKSVSKNLNNFERRAYDMDSLEQQLLNSN